MRKALMILTLLTGLVTVSDTSNGVVCTTTPIIYAMDISRTYERGNWKHYIQHLVPPGDRYLYQGHLYYKGREVQDARNYNDYMRTPWGNLYWVGKTRVTRYGSQGWVRTPNLRFPIGQEVFPTENDYNFTERD